MFERYTEAARKAVFFARYEASQCGSSQIESEHLLLGILREGTELVQRLLLTPAKIEAIRTRVYKRHPVRKKVSTSVDLPLSNRASAALGYAAEEAERMKHDHIGPEHLLLGLSREKSGPVADILREYAISTAQLRTDALLAEMSRKSSTPPPRPKHTGARNLTEAARAGKLGTLIGRECELERVIHILSRRTKSNCVLIGEAGIGKTAIVEGLAVTIATAKAPATVSGKDLIALDVSALIAAGRGRGSEKTLDDVLVSVADRANTILFIRGLFNLAVDGSGWPILEAMHVLEPHLASAEIQCIATGSQAGFRETVERAPMLARHFEIVEVAPVTEEQAIKIVSSLIGQFERFHEVTFAEGVIEKAVYASRRVLPGRHLPDRAIDLLDEAATAVRLRRETEPREMVELRNKIRRIVREMEHAIVNHEFEKARAYSDEQRKENDNLARLREQYKPAEASPGNVTLEDIEAAAAARADVPLAAVQRLLQEKDVGELRRITNELSAAVPQENREWVPFLAAYLVRCSPVEAERLARAIAGAKPQ